MKYSFGLGAWIYLWAFYFVPLIYISVILPEPYGFDDCGFVVEPEVRQVDSSCSIILSQDCSAFAKSGLNIWKFLVHVILKFNL